MMTLTRPEAETGLVERLETIAVVYSLPDATVIQAILRGYGIPSFASGIGHASVHWYAMMALGGIAINVPSSLRPLAISLMPDLVTPRSRAEITAEIRAHGGPYARKRLLIAHLLLPVLFVVTHIVGLVLELIAALFSGPLVFMATVTDIGWDLFVTFLHPSLGLIPF